MGLKEITQREKEQVYHLFKNRNFCSFLIQRIYLQHARLYQFRMTFSWTLIAETLLWCSLQSLLYISLVIFFFFPFNVVWLCLTFVNILACVVLKGISWKGTKIMGLLFFFTSAVLNSILPLYKILQGVSSLMQYFGLVSFLLKNLYKTGSVCVSMGTHLIGEVHMIVKKGELSCSIMFMV